MKHAVIAFMLVLSTFGQSVSAQTVPLELLLGRALSQSETVPAFDLVNELFSDPVEPVAPVPPAPATVQEVLLAVCEAEGLGEDCAKHLLGMLWTESNNISTAVGDYGNARGYFQIWTRLHKIPVACAEDLVCSAEWSLDYLQRNSYPKYVSYAIQCHNSCNFPNGYAAKAMRHGNRLWDTPLEVKQAAPIVLPVALDLAAK